MTALCLQSSTPRVGVPNEISPGKTRHAVTLRLCRLLSSRQPTADQHTGTAAVRTRTAGGGSSARHGAGLAFGEFGAIGRRGLPDHRRGLPNAAASWKVGTAGGSWFHKKWPKWEKSPRTTTRTQFDRDHFFHLVPDEMSGQILREDMMHIRLCVSCPSDYVYHVLTKDLVSRIREKIGGKSRKIGRTSSFSPSNVARNPPCPMDADHPRPL